MRLPFPTRIPLQKAVIFGVIVFAAQRIEHTDLVFSALFFAYMMLSVLTFNYAGGFSRASGTYIFWFALLTCILGGLWKIVLGEPGDSNLVSASTDIATYIVSMAVMLLALFLSRKFVRSPRGLSAKLKADDINLGLASLGCLVANELATFAIDYLPGGSGSITSIILQINVFLPLAILLGTIYTIRTSGGTRSVNVVTLIASLQIFIFYGLIYYSKQGMFTPIACWGIAAASQRYRLRIWQIVLLAGFAVYSVTILSPLSQVGRQLIPEWAGFNERAQLTVDLLSHPIRLRKLYKDSAGPVLETTGQTASFAQGYFDTPQGLMDRLNIIKADDRLDTYTAQGHTEGDIRVVYYFLNWIPHIILPNKEALMPPGASNPGNWYAHEVGGLLSPDDYSTGISFSPTAEAFHLGSWLGIVIVGGLVWTLLFTTVDLICGDLRQSPFGLLAMVLFSHVAPESLITGLVYFIFYNNLAIVIAMIFCAHFAPILGTLLSGNPDQRTSERAPAFPLPVK